MTSAAVTLPARLSPGVVATGVALVAAAQWTVLIAKPDAVLAALLVAGWAFLIGGLLVMWQRPGRFGVLLLLTAASFVLPTLQFTRVPVLWTAGVALDSLFALLLVYLVLTFPQGRLSSRFDRLQVAITIGILVSAVGITTLYDPRLMGCPDCQPGLNLLLLRADPALLTTMVRGITLTIALAAALVGLRLLHRLYRASPPARRVLAPVAIPAASWFLLHTVTRVVRLFTDIVWDGNHPVTALSTFLLVLIPFGVAVGLLRERARRSRVGDLVVELGARPQNEDMRDAIARTLGDPSAEVGFWVQDTGRYVSPAGEPLQLPPPPGRVATHVEGRGQPLAVIVHDTALLDEPRLVDSVSAAARFAVENERLHNELLAKLEEVRASRARIVEAGDVERRRIERNLHDGAQQQLIALGLQLRTLGGRPGVDAGVREGLDAAVERARSALAELRELAHGLHPSILTDEGLPAALEYLAERAPCPVDLDVEQLRLPPPVEATAYYVAAEALSNVAKYSGASSAHVALSRRNGQVVVSVTDDGVGGASIAQGTGLRGLSDRVAAAGGVLTVTSPPGRGTTVTAEIPCE